MFHYSAYLGFTSETNVPLDGMNCLVDTLDALGMKNITLAVNGMYELPSKPFDAASVPMLAEPVPAEAVMTEPSVEPAPEPAPVDHEPKHAEPEPEVDKATLKKKLFELRDKLGSDAVEAVYEKAGNGAASLARLDPALYSAVYAEAEAMLHAAQ